MASRSCLLAHYPVQQGIARCYTSHAAGVDSVASAALMGIRSRYTACADHHAHSEGLALEMWAAVPCPREEYPYFHLH